MKCGVPDDTGGYQRLDRVFQGVENPHTDLLDTSIIQGSVAIGDLIFLEILQGIRNDKQYLQTKQSLLALNQYEMFGKDMAGKCADNYRALRKKESRSENR